AGSTPYTVTVTISHEATTPQVVTDTALVADPPVQATGGNAFAPTEGQDSGTLTVAAFTDPGGPESVADYGATIDWGDGVVTAGQVFPSGAGFVVLGAHAFLERRSPDLAGSPPYTVTVTITHEATTPQVVTDTALVADPPVQALGGQA